MPCFHWTPYCWLQWQGSELTSIDLVAQHHHVVNFGKTLRKKRSIRYSVWASQEAQGQRIRLQSRRHRRIGFYPWVGKIPRRRNWQPTPVFLPRKSHGQRSLAGYTQSIGVPDSPTRLGRRSTDLHSQAYTLIYCFCQTWKFQRKIQGVLCFCKYYIIFVFVIFCF